ncbi:hypothetical protein FPSE_10084 [Fusarium pseudograminearum CS3096]|uniref:Zn(2)-C6 fungal-type domain-containing protein n=1 Tax=Fusarium pseudograminearum (strain CS3096) TaxID=1028729 RepID=K3VBT4_FUSPC|nr:hypothetical protein FPSE_10084 [Fusarium pseudograminearum CS3096]EKJ69768.1 hypothetical protein FPSE_10084 [Fusarium pseudograminearum CS3096]
MTGHRKTACCWTCKIRHVKCDATPSECLQCTSRQVHCHGYGPMPSWMDGGQNEKEEKQRIKLAIKKNFRERKSRQARQRRGHNRAIRLKQNLSKPAQEGAQLNKISQGDSGSAAASPSALAPQSLQSQVLSGQSFAKPLGYDEADLLMHYLDHVFPYQYPFFDKGQWSRGWLLWLISKNGPLCRAALGLAALHKRSLLGETNNHHIELEFHTKAVRQLQDFLLSIDINELRPDNEILVEIIACGISLVSFEVLRGSAADWQPHLSAMASIAVKIHDQPRLLQSSDKRLIESRTTAAMAFQIPVLLWIDLLACVATREAPKLPYTEWLGPSCNFELAHIMGCHNSVMKSIGDLAALSQWKANSTLTDSLDIKEFDKARQNIEDDLENIMDSIPMALIEVRGLSPRFVATQSSNQAKSEQPSGQDCVTRIFAASALAQLEAMSVEVSKDATSTRIRRAEIAGLFVTS